jgi:hypothetical protein
MKFSFGLMLAVFFLFNSFSASCQTRKKSNSNVEIIDFGENQKKTAEKSSHPMIIKTSPISPIFGKGLLELEREVTDYLSIQVGVGATFKPLVDISLTNLIFEEDSNSGSCESELWENDYCDNYEDFDIRRSVPSFLFSFSPRFFFESDGFEGSYIAPKFRYSKNKFEVQSIQEDFGELTRNSTYDVDESITRMDFLVHFGSQVLYPKLSLEYFVGIGASNATEIRQDLGRDDFARNRNGLSETKSTKLILEGGMRLGFQL